MSFPYTPRLQDEKSESLHTQHEYLKILRLRHLQWTTSAEGREAEGVHMEIAQLIEQITDRYSFLLGALEPAKGYRLPGSLRVSPRQHKLDR